MRVLLSALDAYEGGTVDARLQGDGLLRHAAREAGGAKGFTYRLPLAYEIRVGWRGRCWHRATFSVP